MNDLPYYNIPETPIEISTTNTIARLVDGLGFRYRWATEGLTQKEFNFEPIEGSMTISDLINHIYDLIKVTNRILDDGLNSIYETESISQTRENTLTLINEVSTQLKLMTDVEFKALELKNEDVEKQFTFWYLLNGPIADALTHVGQITSWRRISGNPQPKGVNVFLGVKK
jgi:uncharacterized damage-inducible protein DinB